MRTELIEPVVDVLVVLFYAAVSALLTYEGVLSELSALSQLLGGGETGLGLWYLFVGAVALYAGVAMVGGELLLPRLRARLS